VDFIERSFDLYRKTRKRVQEHLASLRQAGINHVRITGEGDVVDICRLTCLEQGITIVPDGDAPMLEVRGLKVILHMEAEA
jgi:hypothetical protein